MACSHHFIKQRGAAENVRRAAALEGAESVSGVSLPAGFVRIIKRAQHNQEIHASARWKRMAVKTPKIHETESLNERRAGWAPPR
jgi:hypothetical protein